MTPLDKDTVKEPETAGALVVLGWVSFITGAFCILFAFMWGPAILIIVAATLMTGGVVMIGLASGLTLLTKIANYLARLVSKEELPESPKAPEKKPAPPDAPYRI